MPGASDLDIGLNDPLGTGRLDGNLVLDGLSCRVIGRWCARARHAGGHRQWPGGISGTRETPSLDGALELTGLRASGLDVRLIVEDGRIRIEFQGDSARSDGLCHQRRWATGHRRHCQLALTR
jgi:translocation and assembly module TamB